MTFTGIHRGVFFDVPATGRVITWVGAAFFTIARNRVTRLWVIGDIDAVKRQLGVGASDPF
jgi:predicted ester cyclase